MCTSACDTFSFFCSAQRVLTASYHGSLWATYLNRTAVVHDVATSALEKFDRIPYALAHASTEAVARGVPPVVDGFAVRDRCRAQNLAFYEAHIRAHVNAVLRCNATYRGLVELGGYAAFAKRCDATTSGEPDVSARVAP